MRCETRRIRKFSTKIMSLLITTRRSRKGSFIRPFTRSPLLEGGVTDTCDPRPFGQASRYSVQGKLKVVALVLILRLTGRPSNVARLVASMVLNSINRVLTGRTRTDVAIERHEIMSPFIGYSDTARAVIFIGWVFRVVATVIQGNPRSELGSISHAVSGVPAFRKTTARLGTVLAFERTRTDGSNVPASAEALPQPSAPLISTDLELNRKSCENPSDVYTGFGWHILLLQRLKNLLARLDQAFARLFEPFDFTMKPLQRSL